MKRASSDCLGRTNPGEAAERCFDVGERPSFDRVCCAHLIFPLWSAFVLREDLVY